MVWGVNNPCRKTPEKLVAFFQAGHGWQAPCENMHRRSFGPICLMFDFVVRGIEILVVSECLLVLVVSFSRVSKFEIDVEHVTITGLDVFTCICYSYHWSTTVYVYSSI